MSKCEARADGAPIGGPRCGKPATHRTLHGDYCDAHTERFREICRNPNTVINVLAGTVPTEEKIASMIRPLPTEEGN